MTFFRGQTFNESRCKFWNQVLQKKKSSETKYHKFIELCGNSKFQINIRHFMWQILSNRVATMKRLKYRHLDAELLIEVVLYVVIQKKSINHFYLNILQFLKFEIYQIIHPFQILCGFLSEYIFITLYSLWIRDIFFLPYVIPDWMVVFPWVLLP